MVEDAINSQLRDLYYASKWVDEIAGLSYCISDGEKTLSNVPEGTQSDYFRTQPVFYVEERDKEPISSRSENASIRNRSGINISYPYYYADYLRPGILSAYISFDAKTVDAENLKWHNVQRLLTESIVIIGAALLGVIVCMVILLVGAGRRYGREGVVMMTPDKLWLDFGLGVLALYETAVCAGFYWLVDLAWQYENFRWIYTLCVLISILAMLPFIWWTMSFTKHCKAGGWWRNTLIHFVVCGICRIIRNFLKSLWAGIPLTAKVGGIGIVLLFMTVLCAAVEPTSVGVVFGVVTAALALLGMLRFANRLHHLEQGAGAMNNGNYDTPIDVTGGELGSIAASMNNISSGINTAVSERMKSELFKTELITNVSHDIRTPLTSLITYTDLLKSEGLDCEKAPEYLDVLIQKSQRLKALTDDLFEASKAASGNVEVNLETIDLTAFIRQVLGELDEKVSASNLDFRMNLPEHAAVQADGKLLWRVMQNLLSNVFEHAQQGSRVYIDVTPEDDEIRLDIKNMSEFELNIDPAELTERFKRGDSARTGDGGSGLGLSIAQSFVLSQGGRLQISIDGDLFKVTVYLRER